MTRVSSNGKGMVVIPSAARSMHTARARLPLALAYEPPVSVRPTPGDVATRASFPIQRRQREAEAGQHVFAVERTAGVDQGDSAVGSVGVGNASVGIEQPRQPDA